MNYKIIAFLPVFITALPSYAHWNTNSSSGKTEDVKQLAAGCANPATSTYLEFNNVRAYIHTGGDMWWDLVGNPRYEVPKDGGAHSLFLGDLWLGGTDVNGQLRIAAQRYRAGGVDYWTGPLSEGTAEISASECEKWDKHYVVSRKMVDEFRAWSLDPGTSPNYIIPQVILDWPAHGDVSLGQSYYLAPFYDNDGDGTYDPYKGDYPYYDLSASTECNRSRDRVPKLFGDHTIWWVFNDKGNVHMETKSDAIGMEIHAQAFAFATQDEINNMTFTNYIIINRSTYSLVNTYFGTNFDPDIGCSSDDLVGCDVVRGLGYAYNGDPIDGNPCDQAPPGDYGDKTPAVGIDFFEGPYQDPDGSDNPKIKTINAVINTYVSGYDDLIPGGTFTSGVPMTIAVRISDNTGVRDSFQWRLTTGLCNDTITCPGSQWSAWSADSVVRGKEGGNEYPTAQLIAHGITVSFETNKNHTVGDMWLIQAIVSSNDNKQCDPSINGLNFGDGVVDNERWGMRRFLYYCNPGIGSCSGPTSDPENGLEYYRLLQGIWKDGKKMVYGGNGHPAGCTGNCPNGTPWPCIPTDFMFPGNPNTDPCGWGQMDGNNGIPIDLKFCGWADVGASDRRFVHSAGPFTLAPGAVNDITTGVVWMRADDGNPLTSVELVRLADDKAQALFDNCFKLLNGPDAPCLTAQELDRELILYISNPPTSNNYLELYNETDPTIPDTGLGGVIYDKTFKFQGYLVYQIKDSTVSVDELDNTTRARLIAKCDIKDNITKIINYEYDKDMALEVPKLMVDGENKGVRHTFQVTDDQFAATTDKRLVNFKKYYFMAIAYSYNNFDNFNPSEGDLSGQRKPFLRGRKNCLGGSIAPMSAIPHKPAPESGGTVSIAKYGDSPSITREEGFGNGAIAVDLESSTEAEILSGGKASSLMFKKGKAPVDIKIVDPLNIKKGNFAIRFIDDPASTLTLTGAKYFGINVPLSAVTDKNYFEVTESASGLLKSGDKFYVSGTSKFDGTYTVYSMDTTGKKIVPCERILDSTKANNNTVSLSGTIYLKHKWILVDGAGDTVATSERTTDVRNEQLIPEYGISITIEQTADPGPVTAFTFNPKGPGTDKVNLKIRSASTDPDNGLLDGTIDFSDPLKPWLAFIPDDDGCNAKNWIRSGSRCDVNSPECNDYGIGNCSPGPFISFDSTEAYEDVAGSTWAPFALAAKDSLGPVPAYAYSADHILSHIHGVDLVITSDQTKWSRAAVIEMEEDYNFSEGKVKKFSLRSDYSIDKNGNVSADSAGSTDPSAPNYISGKSMSWFPGYAIDVETGERLNIMFGENSRLKTDLHGDDMKWNPTPALSSPWGTVAVENGFCEIGAQPGCPFWAGGMHYIYIVGNDNDGSGLGTAYDGCEWIITLINGKSINSTATDTVFYKVLKNIQWVGLPMLTSGYTLNDGRDIPTDARIRLRVSAPYRKYASGDEMKVSASSSATTEQGKYYYVRKGYVYHNGKTYREGSVFQSAGGTVQWAEAFDVLDKGIYFASIIPVQNMANPMFGFSLDEFETELNNPDAARDALDLIGVVPNPYYGMSAYEMRALDNNIKIINLPQRCVISIFNVNGTLIRKFDRDDASNTFIDWDLKNAKGVPISSGVYLIHVQVPDVGEKTLKWFGVIRPIDLEAF